MVEMYLADDSLNVFLTLRWTIAMFYVALVSLVVTAFIAWRVGKATRQAEDSRKKIDIAARRDKIFEALSDNKLSPAAIEVYRHEGAGYWPLGSAERTIMDTLFFSNFNASLPDRTQQQLLDPQQIADIAKTIDRRFADIPLRELFYEMASFANGTDHMVPERGSAAFEAVKYVIKRTSQDFDGPPYRDSALSQYLAKTRVATHLAALEVLTGYELVETLSDLEYVAFLSEVLRSLVEEPDYDRSTAANPMLRLVLCLAGDERLQRKSSNLEPDYAFILIDIIVYRIVKILLRLCAEASDEEWNNGIDNEAYSKGILEFIPGFDPNSTGGGKKFSRKFLAKAACRIGRRPE